jgi:hypothetical protein
MTGSNAFVCWYRNGNRKLCMVNNGGMWCVVKWRCLSYFNCNNIRRKLLHSNYELECAV